MSLNLEEINKIARNLLEIKDKAITTGSKKAIKEYKEYQNYCIDKLSPLVKNKTNKYRKFSNYPDLQQDGFEALMLAFETYNPEKGDFVWWASKYINTRVCRAANAHSTIRFPLKKAKQLQPFKINTIPVLIESKNGPLENVEEAQCSQVIQDAIAELPDDQKQIILLYYEFKDSNTSISKISKELKISRPACVKLLDKAENSLKDKLQNIFG